MSFQGLRSRYILTPGVQKSFQGLRSRYILTPGVQKSFQGFRSRYILTPENEYKKRKWRVEEFNKKIGRLERLKVAQVLIPT